MSDTTDMVAVVTGASSGIGKAAAADFVKRGWRVIGIGRNADRSAAAEAELRELADDPAQVTFLRGDLALLSDVERLANEIALLAPKVDILANNAGGMPSEMAMTDEGLEYNFASNHVGPFHFTNLLLPLLKAAAQGAPKGGVRILNTASDGSEMIPTINLDDLQNLENWNPGAAYCTGKLANVIHARALAARLGDSGIVAHALHPGTVGSNFFSHTPQSVQDAYRDAPKLTNEQGADTLIWLATSQEAGEVNGGYWFERAPRDPNPVVNDAAIVDRFWTESEKLVASVSA